jgi:citrate lyase subunit beta / citryl-CoA lyase
MSSASAARVTRARSYLFVPDAGADAVILDLEDAVSPKDKSVARDAIDNFVTQNTHAIVRINALDTEWAASDIECASVRASPA